MKIVVTYKVPEEAKFIYNDIIDTKAKLCFLKEISEESRTGELKSANIILAWNLPRELSDKEIRSLNNIRFLQLLSAGYDHLNFDLISDGCIIAANQGAYAEPMAEHTVAMILSLAKHFLINHRKMMDGEFDQLAATKTLKNAVCGIVGYGSIGKASARLLRNFGVKIFAINTSGKTADEVEFIGTLADLENVLKSSDVVIISIPLNEKTNGLIGKRELELMRHDAILVNVARGAIINEKDLYFHLKSHPDFMVGLDAWWNEPFNTGEFKLNYPFFDLPNILGSPHNSAIIPGALLEGHKRALENIKRFLEGKPVKGIIQKD